MSHSAHHPRYVSFTTNAMQMEENCIKRDWAKNEYFSPKLAFYLFNKENDQTNRRKTGGHSGGEEKKGKIKKKHLFIL